MTTFVFPYRHYVVALVLLFVISVTSALFGAVMGLTNIALLYLLPVLVIALRGDMKATTIVTAITVVVFDLLNVPPQFSFSVHDLVHAWSFILFFLVGYTITYQAKRIQANAIKEMFLDTLSHDLKTPLSSLLGNVSLLLKDHPVDSQTRRALLLQINDSGQRINRLASNLLDSARLKDGNGVLRPEWCDFEDIIGVALQEFRYHPNQHRIEVVIDPDTALFWGDCALLVRLMVNLMDNALKYTEEGKRIRITVATDRKTITLLFFNESSPIKKSDLKNLFERFYRIDDRADVGGSGIGLSICRDIAAVHGGTIDARNCTGGVCFEIRLPIRKASDHPIGEAL
ncbi:MAG: sensor histidine kinase [Campylobacterota bacterium]